MMRRIYITILLGMLACAGGWINAQKTIYLKPCEEWTVNNAKFGVYDITHTSWISGFMTQLEGCDNAYYSISVPSDCQRVVFGRFKSSVDAPFGWGGEGFWGQSVNVDISLYNGFEVQGWGTYGEDNGKGYGTPFEFAHSHQVTFDSNGHGSDPASACVENGGKVAEPTNLTAEGYAVVGWYTDSECTNAWSFTENQVNSDMTLYAKWDEDYYTPWNLKGSFSNWNSCAFLKKKSALSQQVGYYEQELAADTEYEFKVKSGDSWYGCNTSTQTISFKDYKFYTSHNNNLTIHTTVAGKYLFKIDYSGTPPTVSVYYPDAYSLTSSVAEDGQSVELTLTVSGASPTSVRWYRNNKELAHSGMTLTALYSGTYVARGYDALDVEIGESNEIDLGCKEAYVLTTSDNDYYTLYLGFEAAIPEGIKAFTGELDAEETKLTLTQVEGTLPARTAVLVKSPESTGQFEFVETFTSAAAIANNSLYGVESTTPYTTIAATTGKMVLTLGVDQEGKVAFRRPSNASGSLKANRACLPITVKSNPAPIRVVMAGDEATDVEQIATEAAAQKVIEDGHVYIIKEGVKYTVLGQIVK